MAKENLKADDQIELDLDDAEETEVDLSDAGDDEAPLAAADDDQFEKAESNTQLNAVKKKPCDTLRM